MSGELVFCGWVTFATVAIAAAIVGAIVLSYDRSVAVESAREREMEDAL